MAQLATRFEEGSDIVAALEGEDACVEVFRDASLLEQGLSLRRANGPFAACDLIGLATFALMNRLISEMCGRGLVVLHLLFHGDWLSEHWLCWVGLGPRRGPYGAGSLIFRTVP